LHAWHPHGGSAAISALLFCTARADGSLPALLTAANRNSFVAIFMCREGKLNVFMCREGKLNAQYSLRGVGRFRCGT
jgi:hypothetical protein